MAAGKLSCLGKALKCTQYSFIYLFIHSVPEDYFICTRHLGGGCDSLCINDPNSSHLSEFLAEDHSIFLQLLTWGLIVWLTLT